MGRATYIYIYGLDASASGKLTKTLKIPENKSFWVERLQTHGWSSPAQRFECWEAWPRERWWWPKSAVVAADTQVPELTRVTRSCAFTSNYISGWWFQPLWKISKSDWIIIPTIGEMKHIRQLGWLFLTIGENKPCSKPPTRYTLW